MPARSRAQQRYLAAKFGVAWLRRHHFDTKGPLPDHIGVALKHRKRRRR